MRALDNIRAALWGITIGCLGIGACGLFGWAFWKLIDAFGPAGFFMTFAAAGAVSAAGLVCVELWQRRAR